jgi:hypothetical protein
METEPLLRRESEETRAPEGIAFASDATPGIDEDFDTRSPGLPIPATRDLADHERLSTTQSEFEHLGHDERVAGTPSGTRRQ